MNCVVHPTPLPSGYGQPHQPMHSGPVGGGAQYNAGMRYMGQQMMSAGQMQPSSVGMGGMRPVIRTAMPGMVPRPSTMGGMRMIQPGVCVCVSTSTYVCDTFVHHQGIPGTAGMGIPGSGMVQQPPGQQPHFAGNSYMIDGSGAASVQAVPNPSYSVGGTMMRPPAVPPYSASMQQVAIHSHYLFMIA